MAKLRLLLVLFCCFCFVRGDSECGDGILGRDIGEECDDGNRVSGDGCSSQCKWEPPIGIPKPDFGISESHYSLFRLVEGEDCSSHPLKCYDFGSGLEAYHDAGYGPFTHYVDGSHQSCNQNNNFGFGSPSEPLCDIPNPIQAGSVVEIHSKTQRESTSYIIVEGTASSPIFVRGPDIEDLPLLGTIVSKGPYVIWENLRFFDGTIGVRPHNDGPISHHVAIRHCEFSGDGSPTSRAGLFASGSSSAEFHDITFYRNHIHHGGDYLSTPENDVHGMVTGSYVYNVFMLDNCVHHMGGDSIQLSHGGQFTAHHVYIGRNHMYSDGENAVDIKQVNNVVVSQNIMHDYLKPYGDGGGGFLAVVVHYNPSNIYFLNNYIYNSGEGMITSGATNIAFIGNIIRNLSEVREDSHSETSAWRPSQAFRAYSSVNVAFVNNLIYDCVVGIESLASGAKHIIQGNIFLEMKRQGSFTGFPSYALFFDPNTEGEELSTINTNLFYDSDDECRITWRGQVMNGSELNAALISRGKPGNNILENPNLINAPAGNFRQGEDSPIIDVTSEPDVYGEFYQEFGIDIRSDFDGAPRPQGDKWDIGPFEYGSYSTLDSTSRNLEETTSSSARLTTGFPVILF